MYLVGKVLSNEDYSALAVKKPITCCNLDDMLNFKTLFHLDNYLDENENVCVHLTERVPYMDKDEGILYMSYDDAVKYINRGGRIVDIVKVQYD